jgi:uncharacterized membrane protein YgcG
MDSRVRVTGASLSVAGIAFAAGTTAVLLQRWRQPNYAMPLTIVVLAGSCACLVVAGAVLSAHRREVLRPWLTVLTTLLFIWAFLTMFSIGVLLLVAAIVILVMRIRLAEPRAAVSWRARVGAGLLLSLGLAPLSVLAIEQPVVDCTQFGVSTASPIWTWFGSGGGASSGTSSSGGGDSSSPTLSRGSVTIGSTTFAFTCTGSRLTRFAQLDARH